MALGRVLWGPCLLSTVPNTLCRASILSIPFRLLHDNHRSLSPSLRRNGMSASLCGHNFSAAARDFPRDGFESLNPAQKIEEELIPTYKAERFYPVRMGQVFQERYQAVGKLGYGATSTVWLCRDLSLESEYVTLKVYTNRHSLNREVAIYEHLNSVDSTHSGKGGIRKLLDSFEIAGPHGDHSCLVHEPMGTSVHEFMGLLPHGVFTKDLLKAAMRQVLASLDYLHTDAHVIHTDLQPRNLLLRTKDKSIFPKYEQSEFDRPVPRKVCDDRTIYLSRRPPPSLGMPVLCDFGEARLARQKNNDDIMPDLYRAPEVILGMDWDEKVDVWNAAMVAWDLFEPTGHHLFQAQDPETNQVDNAHHLAEMIALLGPPPLEFLQRSETSLVYWDEAGNWRGLAPIPEGRTLGVLEQRLEEGEDKAGFLEWVDKMLRWMPEERATAKEALLDPWLLEGLFRTSES